MTGLFRKLAMASTAIFMQVAAPETAEAQPTRQNNGTVCDNVTQYRYDATAGVKPSGTRRVCWNEATGQITENRLPQFKPNKAPALKTCYTTIYGQRRIYQDYTCPIGRQF